MDWKAEDGLAGVTVGVLGMARTGLAVAGALSHRGARILAYDQKPVANEAAIQELQDAGLTLSIGNGFPGMEVADLIIPSPGMPAGTPVLQDAVERGVPVLSEIEIAYRISRAPLIAFTGTNGKSTTTSLCGHILCEGGLKARIGGNLAPGTPLVTLADTASTQEILVAEISSFQLEWVQEFRPRVGCVLNVSEEHRDRHPTIEEYAAIKSRIVERQAGSDLAIFGNDFAKAFPELLLGLGRHYRFCVDHPVESGAYMDDFTMRVVGRLDSVEGALPDLKIDCSRFGMAGQHNLENAMAAALAALEMGVRPEAVERALRTFPGVPHRMERVAEIRDVQYVNNSMCTNPAAAVASLAAIRGGLIVICGGRSKGLNSRPFGEELARKAKWCLLIGETSAEIEDYLNEAGNRRYEHAASMEAAVNAASALASPGDTVLLAPGFSSFDMYKDFEARGLAFIDAVRALPR